MLDFPCYALTLALWHVGYARSDISFSITSKIQYRLKDKLDYWVRLLGKALSGRAAYVVSLHHLEFNGCLELV